MVGSLFFGCLDVSVKVSATDSALTLKNYPFKFSLKIYKKTLDLLYVVLAEFIL